MVMREFTVGSWVKWNGAGPGMRPRWYVGQIKTVNTHTYDIVDNEWYAVSEVAKTRVLVATQEDLS